MATSYHFTDRSSSGKPIAGIRTLVDMKKQKEMALAVAGNLQRLMDADQISQAQLSRKTGIGQSTISNLLSVAKPLEINPRMSTLVQLGAHFGVPAWLFLVGDLPMDLLRGGRIAAMIHNYTVATDEGRQTIDRVAESEVRYAGNPRKPLFSKQA